MRTVEGKIASFSCLTKYLEDTELSFESFKDVVLQHWANWISDLKNISRRTLCWSNRWVGYQPVQMFPAKPTREATLARRAADWIESGRNCSIRIRSFGRGEQLDEKNRESSTIGTWGGHQVVVTFCDYLPMWGWVFWTSGDKDKSAKQTQLGSDIRCALSQLIPQFEEIIDSNKCH